MCSSKKPGCPLLWAGWIWPGPKKKLIVRQLWGKGIPSASLLLAEYKLPALSYLLLFPLPIRDWWSHRQAWGGVLVVPLSSLHLWFHPKKNTHTVHSNSTACPLEPTPGWFSTCLELLLDYAPLITHSALCLAGHKHILCILFVLASGIEF